MGEGVSATVSGVIGGGVIGGFVLIIGISVVLVIIHRIKVRRGRLQEILINCYL